ncbi:MAG: glycosyltransferase family 4 protein [Bacteroidota bacterium]|nr:glycosyltransferase family 4 protein [Bacteroidota bacterium]
MHQNSRRPEIAYYSINDPLDKRSWSGATYYVGQTLSRHVGNVHFLGPVKIPWLLDKTFRGLQKLSRFFFKTEWIPKYSLLKNKYAAKILKKKMKGRHYDFLIGPAAASELGCLNTNIPVVYFGDATYKIYSENYKKEFKSQNAFSKWEGEHLEKCALKKSSLIIFTSQWAKNSAINDYNVPAEKIEVIQMGANIDEVPKKGIIFNKEKNETLTLLFLSVDWDRKGGAIAFETLEELYNKGIDVKLQICGCIPPPEFNHSAMEVIPFLNKNKPEDFKKFVEILSNAHFLLLPTRADCTPVVNSESNAYGMPVITTNVGGVSEQIIDGINGYCLSLDANGKEYADVIFEIFSNKKRYHNLIETSRKRFDEELNWHSFAKELKKVLNKHKILS